MYVCVCVCVCVFVRVNVGKCKVEKRYFQKMQKRKEKKIEDLNILNQLPCGIITWCYLSKILNKKIRGVNFYEMRNA